MKPLFSFQRGAAPLLVSIPHAGTFIPQAIGERLTSRARDVPDTDWFVDRLYQWVTEYGAGLLIANYSRYVIDLNRPPDDAALYTGAGTGLLPAQTFAGQPLYQDGMEPGSGDIQERIQQFWRPYHDKLSAELQVLKQQFGYAIVLDAHSIISEVPMLFDGILPDLNLGSFRGASANPDLVSKAMTALGNGPGFSLVLDGRFQGGYITRHYGYPDKGIHALQLEMAQSAYMCERPPAFDEARAERIIPVLRNLIDTLTKWSPADA